MASRGIGSDHQGTFEYGKSLGEKKSLDMESEILVLEDFLIVQRREEKLS